MKNVGKQNWRVEATEEYERHMNSSSQNSGEMLPSQQAMVETQYR
jgi:hypothetical protein